MFGNKPCIHKLPDSNMEEEEGVLLLLLRTCRSLDFWFSAQTSLKSFAIASINHSTGPSDIAKRVTKKARQQKPPPK
jgi:hypothetical protein